MQGTHHKEQAVTISDFDMKQAANLASRFDLAALRQMAAAPKTGTMSQRKFDRFQSIVATAIEIHESRAR